MSAATLTITSLKKNSDDTWTVKCHIVPSPGYRIQHKGYIDGTCFVGANNLVYDQLIYQYITADHTGKNLDATYTYTPNAESYGLSVFCGNTVDKAYSDSND